MGAWGAGPFENDDALDWVDELEEGEGLDVLEDSLALDSEGYPEVSEVSMALAAAEAVAAACGRPVADLPPEVRDWVTANPAAARLAPDAHAALTRLEVAETEAHDLWEEAGELEEFVSTINDCKARLSPA